MFYYKCENCQSEWNGIKMLEICPFCDTKIAVKTSNFTKIGDALAYIFSAHGFDLIKENNRLVALLSDYAPTLERERKLIRVALNTGVYGDLVSVNKSDKAAQELSVKKAISKLHSDAFMDPIIAKEVIDWFVSCLGWLNNKPGNFEIKKETFVANSSPYVSATKNTTIKINIGETIVFGSYRQDDLRNPSGIKWEVISVEGNRALLLSKKCLDVYPYNQVKVNKTWQNSDLRRWLNREFFNTAFTSKEMSAIAETEILTSKNPRSNANSGNVVTDKVFILGLEDISEYGLSKKKLICQATKYAVYRGIYCNSDTADAYWWLRTPGCFNESAMFVTDKARLDELGYPINSANRGIRPAIWLDLEKIDSI